MQGSVKRIISINPSFSEMRRRIFLYCAGMPVTDALKLLPSRRREKGKRVILAILKEMGYNHIIKFVADFE